MDTELTVGLDTLKQRLLTMASHAEAATNQALQALMSRDYELALRVKDNDRVVDAFEVEIDELAIALLSRSPPTADLRFITVAMKIAQNLERVGDEAAKVAKRARDLSQQPPVKVVVDLPQMARRVLAMLKAALDAFVERDAAAARAVIPQDQAVDAMNKQAQGELARHMAEHPGDISGCLQLMVVAKCLERIADHATNMAESVVFLCEARDIRHSPRSPAASPG